MAANYAFYLPGFNVQSTGRPPVIPPMPDLGGYPGYQKVDYATWYNNAQASPEGQAALARFQVDQSRQEAGNTGPTVADIISNAQKGMQTMTNWSQVNGQWVQNAEQTAAETAKNEAAVAAGTMKKVPVGNGFGYIPTGSAADKALSNPSLNNTAGGAPVSSGTVTAQSTGGTPANLTSAAGGSTGGLYLAADGKTVTDAQGNYVSLPDYKRLTGQQNVADEKLNWSFVNPTPAPTGGNTGGNAGGNTGGGTGGGTTGFTPTGDPTLDGILTHIDSYLQGLQKNGQTINPNIQLTPSDVQKFLDQATGEISPYYASQITAIKDDLTNNLNDLQKQYDLQKQSDESKFKQSLASKRESLAGVGLGFSGVRGQQEQNLTEAQTNTEQQLAQQAANNAQKAISTTESKIGSRNLGNLNFPGLQEYSASNVGDGSFTSNRTLPFTTGLSTGGDITGDLQYSQNRDITNLSNFYQQAEVNKRQLNFTG